MLKKRGLAAHWKVLTVAVVPVAAVGAAAVGLAIAASASMAGTHRAAGPVPGQSGWARQDLLGATGHPTPHPHARKRAAASAGCMVSYTPVHWPGSFLAKVIISNMGKTDIHGWTLTFTFAGNEAVSSAWNATFTQTGSVVTARNQNFDATIRHGASQALGFLGAQRSDGPAPDSFRVNGMVCR